MEDRSKQGARRGAGQRGRQEAERALRESEERYRIISELTSDFAYVFGVGPDGTLVLEWMTGAFAHITGYEPQEIWPQGNWMALIHPPDLPEVRRRLQIVLSGQPDVCEARIVTRSGTLRWVQIHTRPIWDPAAGRVVRIYGAVRDVTNRREAVEALRESEGRYRTLAELARDYIYVVGHDGRLSYLNTAAAGLFGGRPEDFLGRRPEDLFSPGTFERQAANLQRVFASGQPLFITAKTVVADRAIWQDTSLMPILDEQGAVKAVLGISRDVTDRRKTEEALQRSELQYRTTIDSMRDPIHVVDRDLRILLMNTAFRQWLDKLGVAHEALGCSVFDLFPFLPERVRDEYRQVLETGKTVITEEETTLAGQVLITETRKIPVFENGRVVRVVTVVHDITARKRAEQALRESEQRYRTLVETSPDAITLTDLEGNILMVNQRGAQLYGADSPADLIGQNAVELIAPEDRAAALANLQRTLAEGNIASIEYHVRRKDGTYYPAELNAACLLDAEGRPQAFIGVLRDISERKRAEESLWQTRLVIEHSPVMLYRIRAGEDLSFEFVSDNVSQMGYSAAELLSGAIPIASLLHPDDCTRVVTEAREHIARGEGALQREYRLLTKDGEVRWVDDRSVVVRGADGRPTHFQGVVMDITERKRLEEQFLQSQKMESIGRLAGSVAHDFNNLLTAIRGYAGLARDALQPADPVRRDIEQVLKGAEQATRLTGQLLAFSRRQIIDTRPLNLNDLVFELDSLIRRLVGEDIAVKLALAPDLGVSRMDPGQIEQVILNLVVNARDAMPDGGTLTIQTGNVTLGEEYGGRQEGIGTDPYVLLSVQDTGVGMSDEIRAHLFEPFFTTKQAGHGTGLGLATVYGIVKQHQGHIAVQSAPGSGTTVQVYLPRVTAQAGRLPQHEETTVSLPRGSETVLVVEDEPAVRTLIARILGSLGYQVLEAADGSEAVRLVRWYQGKMHLLLTDVIMPQMDGKILSDLLLDAVPDLRVLYVTGYAGDVIAQRGILIEGAALLRKPFTAALLAGKVREVLDAPGREEPRA